jgi:elongation factor 1 alpha-like protein
VLIVEAAGKKPAPSSAGKKQGGGDNVTGDLKALKIEEAPLPKSKNLDVLSEFEKSKSKKTASFVVVGE